MYIFPASLILFLLSLLCGEEGGGVGVGVGAKTEELFFVLRSFYGKQSFMVLT
jgi:hypothetical protein